MNPPARGESIPWLIHQMLNDRPAVSSGEVARAAGVTRQAAHYNLRKLVDAGELVATGEGRGRRYARRSIWQAQLEIAGLQEDRVWQDVREDVPEVKGLPQAADRIAGYAFTEMLNNAIDHSGSAIVRISLGVTSRDVRFRIADEGVGVFENVRSKRNLEDHGAAIQEISKGKLTTDPARHSGQGIFFTSKAVDLFVLSSNGWRWIVDNRRRDQTIARVRSHQGTNVDFVVAMDPRQTLSQIFDEFTDDDFAFARSRTLVRLFELEGMFVSRSEAKRLTRNLDEFREVVVDFKGVEQVGQGFTDEIFRVWQREHPDTELEPVNMNEAVRRLVEQARASER
ncbi:MAG: STAS-like domain-containing protein [Actinomycetota bacterium]